MKRLAIYVEAGEKRTFAGAVEWPGWSRSGKVEADAIEALLAYADRYRAVLAAATIAGFPSAGQAADWTADVVERVAGGSGTAFGVPSHAPAADGRPIDPGEAAWLVAILEASWAAFDAAAGAARGHALRLGPRGGGRDLDKIVGHVREADASYLVSLGVRPPKLTEADEADHQLAVRRRAGQVVVTMAAGKPIEDANKVSKPWSPRYYVRRAAWHALDHAWELEDRRID